MKLNPNDEIKGIYVAGKTPDGRRLIKIRGTTGIVGATGPQGATGAQGSTGPQGQTGPTGSGRLNGYTVSTLPTGVTGDTAYVTDALTPAFLVTVVGGGATKAPVFYDGTNWVVI